VGLVGALRVFPESRSPERLKLDPLGVALIAAASFCLIYPLVQGRELGWPAWAFALMAVGLALLGAFAAVERRGHGTPLIEPSLLRNRAFTSGLLVGIAFFSGFAGLLLVLSVFLQSGLHFSPEHAGLTFTPTTLASAVAAGASFPLMAKFGRRVLQAGVLIITASLVALALIVGRHGLDTTTWTMVPALVPFGLGMGFVFGPLFNVILAGVEDREVGSASGTLNAVQQLGNSIGVALLATIFFSLLDHGHLSPAALRTTTLIAAGLFALAFVLSFLLPREARMDA
jgi:MFS family permease